MNKSTPRAKGIRTFVFLLAGSSAGWVTLNLATNFKAGATIIALNVIAAFVGGLAAYLMAFTSITGQSAITRALYTFLQGIGAWLLTAGVDALTVEALGNFGRGFMQAAVAAFIAAVVALVQNSVEGTQAPPG
jgi:hypothetical protein